MAAPTVPTTFSSYVPGYLTTVFMAPTTYSGGAYTVGSYTKVAQSVDVKAPESELGEIKITNNDSPNNSEELRPGMVKPGTMEFDWVWTSAQHATLYATYGDGNVYGWKELYADGSFTTCLGWIKKIDIETKTENEANKGKVTIQLMTKPSFSLS